jgi:hypothetical protein
LPSYQAFNRRFNEHVPAIEQFTGSALATSVAPLAPSADRLIDFMPVMLAKGSRSNSERVAAEVADKGFCAGKST